MNRIKLYRFVPKIIRRELYNIKARITQDVIIKFGASGGFNNSFEGRNLVNYQSVIKNSNIGYGTYISGNCNLLNVHIGKYCSIGQRVSNAFASHPTSDWVSTHPAFFSPNRQAGFSYVNEQKFSEHRFIDKQERISNTIGNDVWIGNDVKILPGIIIGDGAIIAAGAVITKEVEPYSIVGGVPAKIIRCRFEQDEVDFLLQFKWWEKGSDWVRNHASDFSNIKDFIENSR